MTDVKTKIHLIEKYFLRSAVSPLLPYIRNREKRQADFRDVFIFLFYKLWGVGLGVGGWLQLICLAFFIYRFEYLSDC